MFQLDGSSLSLVPGLLGYPTQRVLFFAGPGTPRISNSTGPVFRRSRDSSDIQLDGFGFSPVPGLLGYPGLIGYPIPRVRF